MYTTHSPVYMAWSDMQFWFGFLLFFCGLSLHRIGPAFKRNNFGKPLLLLGFVLIFLPSSQLSSIEDDLFIFMVDNLPWVFLSSSGIYFVLYGSDMVLSDSGPYQNRFEFILGEVGTYQHHSFYNCFNSMFGRSGPLHL